MSEKAIVRAEWLRRRRVWLLLPQACLLLVGLGVALLVAPAEARLGSLIKLVYLHGALVLSGLSAFSVAGIMGIVAITVRRPEWFRGANSAGFGALLVWILSTLSSMLVTWLAWGQPIAWHEPRVKVTALILGAALVLELVVRLVGQGVFGAAVRVVMGVAPWLATRQADLIRHPVDPIGGSASSAIQTYFGLVQVAVAGLVLLLLAWLWTESELRTHRRAGSGMG